MCYPRMIGPNDTQTNYNIPTPALTSVIYYKSLGKDIGHDNAHKYLFNN
jgi:hypothetical protein